MIISVWIESTNMSPTSADHRTRVLSPRQLLAWAEENTEIMRLRTARDTLPGGYMAALAPVLVAWRESDPDAEDPYAVIRNVNYGGNPLEKTTVLHSVHVPLSGVEFAEFTLVPSTRGGLLAPSHHGQLRFVFRADKQPELLNLAGSRTGTDAAIGDLVLSWESWRAPGERFNLIKGLDASYGLSLRAYAGPQRFLEDSLRKRDWFSYRLRMPGAEEGLTELLGVALALGDGAARRTIARLLRQGEKDWLAHAPMGENEPAPEQQWQALQQRVEYSEINEPELIVSEEATYQSLLRSCATLARYTVLLSASRLVQRGHTDGLVLDELPEPILGTPEGWMGAVARAKLSGIFLRAPLAVGYILRHPESIPVNIPEELARAGLIEQKDRKPSLTQYSRDDNNPYGPFGIAYR